MATNVKRPLTFEWVQGPAGEPAPIKEFTEEDSQSYVAGAPLVFDTSSTDVKLATDTTVVGIGLALTAASGTGGTTVPVLLFREGHIYRAPVLNAGAAAANNTNQIGTAYSWVARTDGYGYGIDTADSGSNDWFIVESLDPRYDSGSNPGFVLVRVLGTVFDDTAVA